MDRNFGYGRRDFTASSRSPIAATAVTRAAFPTHRRELAVTGPTEGAMTIGSDVAGASVEVATDEDGVTTFQERLPDGSAGDSIVISLAPSPDA